MIQHPSTNQDTHASVSPPRPDVENLRRRVRALDPALDEESPRFGAALLLLCGELCRPNTHRLARLTGLDPTFVARCARRLVDSGVWQPSGKRCRWRDPRECSEAFWSEVDVALGLAHRKTDGEGRPNWIRAGSRDAVTADGAECVEEPKRIAGGAVDLPDPRRIAAMRRGSAPGRDLVATNAFPEAIWL